MFKVRRICQRQTEKRASKKKCGYGSFHTSEPDLVIYWPSGEIYYDITVVNELSKTNLGKKGSKLMEDARKRKIETYVSSGLIPSENFICLPMLAGGALDGSLLTVLKCLANVSGRERDEVVQDFKIKLQQSNGTILSSQIAKAVPN